MPIILNHPGKRSVLRQVDLQSNQKAGILLVAGELELDNVALNNSFIHVNDGAKLILGSVEFNDNSDVISVARLEQVSWLMFTKPIIAWNFFS